jgi:outer membrane protein W
MRTLISTLVVCLLCTTAATADTKIKDVFVKMRAGRSAQSITLTAVNQPTDPIFKKTGGAINIAELAASYFVTPNCAIELSAGYMPQFTTITGPGLVGSPATDAVAKVNTLVGTVTAQFHLPLDPAKRFVPYIGGGYSHRFMFFNDEKVKMKGKGGFVAQAGMDLFVIGNDVALNFDIKYMPKISHNVTTTDAAGAVNQYSTSVSSCAFTVGLGVRF